MFSFTAMVQETGEATERFLRSMAAGDAAATAELQEAAAAGLAAVSSYTAPTPQGEMALGPLSSQLLERAQLLNKQMARVLSTLRSLRPAGVTGVTSVTNDMSGGAAAEGQGVAGEGAGVAGGAVALLQGSHAEATAVLGVLRQVLEATEQLQHMALQLQQITAVAVSDTAAAAAAAADDDDDGDVVALVPERVSGGVYDMLVGAGPGSPFLMGGSDEVALPPHAAAAATSAAAAGGGAQAMFGSNTDGPAAAAAGAGVVVGGKSLVSDASRIYNFHPTVQQHVPGRYSFDAAAAAVANGDGVVTGVPSSSQQGQQQLRVGSYHGAGGGVGISSRGSSSTAAGMSGVTLLARCEAERAAMMAKEKQQQQPQ
jgi:hypothetical protein